MGERERGEITRLLSRWRAGDLDAEAQLFELVMPDLRRLAGYFMSRERHGHTLSSTALINEAYLRLVDNTKPLWQNRTHFVAAAAQLMRRIMVDHARERNSLKRGGGAGSSEAVSGMSRAVVVGLKRDDSALTTTRRMRRPQASELPRPA